MKKKQTTAIVTGLASVVFALTSTFSTAAVENGTAAPDFTLPAADGSEQSLSGFKGKYVVLEWYNPDCPFVVKHYRKGHMQALQEEFVGKEVVWLLIGSSAPGKQGHLEQEDAQKIIGEKGIKATHILLDPSGEVGQLYGAQRTPHMFVIDPEGKLIYQGAIDDKPSFRTGDIENSKNYVRAALESAMAGEPIASPQTEAYGCSVKYAR